MTDLVVYDEPTAHRHRVANFAPSPDRQRPGWVDLRIIVARCGMVIALTGIPKNRPARLTACAGCFGG
jgi:hypothetical protein